MNLFKKIVPLSALGVSLLTLVLAVVDCLSAELALFSLLPVQLLSVLLLLCSLGVTLIACIERTLRRPLVLLACLLHTPIGGGLLLLYVFDLAFPDQLPMALLLPYVMLLVSVASALQAGVTVLCDGIYAEEEAELAREAEEAEALEDAERKAYAALLDDDPSFMAPNQQTDEAPEAATEPEAAPVSQPVEKPAPASRAVPAEKPAPVSTPKVVPAPVRITEEDEDDLAPIPKKKRGKQPSFETGNRTARPVVPVADPVAAEPEAPAKAPAAPKAAPAPTDAKTMVIPVVQEKPRYPKETGKKQYTDPFGLLTEDRGSEPTADVKSIFGDDGTREQ